jgi:hypothetical protein
MQVSEFRAAIDRGRREFPWVDLEECSVRGWSLAGLSLRQAKLDRADFSEADCTEMSLLKVSAIASQWVAARLDRANCQKANFHQANFVGAQLTATQLQNADLSAANLGQAKLLQANLSGAIVLGACFVAADLTGATLDPSAIAQADFTDATMPDGRVFSADWEPAIVDPAGDLQSDPVAAAPIDRPNRHLMSNPNFAVPDVGPPPPPPVPTSLKEAWQRLPKPLLWLWCFGYCLWGGSLGLMDAPIVSWPVAAASSLTGLLGVEWGFLALTGGMLAIVLAAPIGNQIMSFLLGGSTGIVVGLGTKILMNVSWSLALRNSLLAMASAMAIINISLGLPWLSAIGAMAFTFSAMPLWPIARNQSLTPAQQMGLLGGLAVGSLLFGGWLGT